MGMKLGISKHALLHDYYFDEIPLIFERYNALFGNNDAPEERYADEIW